jgi:ketosteroid isomerase-like protein
MALRIARTLYLVRKLLLVGAGMAPASGLVNPPRSLAQSADANPAQNISAQVQRDNIEQTMASFLAAFANRDLPAFSEFFAEDATMFFPPSATGSPSRRVEGKTEIRRAFTEFYDRLGLGRTTGRQIQPQGLLIQRYDSFAVVTFHLGSDSTRGRRSFVLRRTGSEWKVVHLHASDSPI